MGRARGRCRQTVAWRDADAPIAAGARSRVTRGLQGAAGPRAGRAGRTHAGRQGRLHLGAQDSRGRCGRRLMTAETEDKLAIQELIARYPLVVDGRDWDGLDELFTADARIDFSAFGGPVDSPAGIKKFLADSLGMFARSQHMMGLPAITLDGDRARSRTSCTNPMVITDGEGVTKVWLIGLWYDDEFERTAAGWRFTSRRQERCYSVVGLADTPLGPA